MGSPHWQRPSPRPAGAAPWPGSQREREQSESRVATRPLQAAALACQHPKHQLPLDPMAKGLRYQRCSSSPKKSQGLGTLCQRRARHRLAGAALVTHLHQPTSGGAEPGEGGSGPHLLSRLATA